MFIYKNFSQICKSSEEFLVLSCKELKYFLEANELNIQIEDDTFQTIVRWIEYDFPNRRCYLPSLLSCVRFGFCSEGFYEKEVLAHPYILDNPDIQDTLSSISKILEDAKTEDTSLNLGHPIYTPRIPHQVLFALGGWSSGGATFYMETYDVRANRWLIPNDKCNEGMGLPRAYHGAVALGQNIYVVGGYDGYQQYSDMKCYNPMTRAWTEKACLHQARCYISLTVLNNEIYAIGGYDGKERTNTAEKYDPSINQWTKIASMNRRRSDSDATACNGLVYIAGGFNGQEVLNCAEVYDPQLDNWKLIRNLNSPRSGNRLITYKNNVYALGGWNGMIRLNTVERYDAFRDFWCPVANMWSRRSNFATVVLEDSLYVIGGYDGVTTIPSCESYNDTTKEWKWAASMNMRRSGVGACVICDLPNGKDYTYHGFLKMNQ